MATPLATAFVRIRPDTARFGSEMTSGIDRNRGAFTRSGQKHGRLFGTTFAKSTAGPFRAMGGVLTRSVAGIGAAFAAVGAAKFLGSSIKEASDLNETLSKTQNVFGPLTKQVIRWSKTSASSFGLSQSAALAAASQFGDMFQQLGFGQRQATKTSEKMVKLAADLGSFHNVDPSDVLERIGAAFRGEYDSLQQLIPNISAARVQQEALRQTHKKSVNDLTAAEKATATLSIVQRDGARAANDFAETSGGLANQQRILQANLDDTKAKLGQVLVPALAKVTGFINDKVLPGVQGFIDFIVNKAIPKIGAFGKALVTDFIPIDQIKALFDSVAGWIADRFLPSVKQEIKPIRVGRLIEFPAVEKAVGLDRLKAGLKLLRQNVVDFFAGLRGEQNRLSIGRMFEEFEPSDAQKLGQTIRDLFNTAIGDMDWAKIGQLLGEALILAIKTLTRSTREITQAIVNLLKSIDWFEAGKRVGLAAAPFGIGFVSTLFDGVIDAFKEHPFETLLQLLMVVPIGRVAGLLGKAVAKIPVLRLFKPLFDGVAHVGGLVERYLVGPVLRAIGNFIKATARGFLEGFRRVFPTIGKRFGDWLRLFPTRIGVAAIDIVQAIGRMMRGLGNAILSFGAYIGRVIGHIIGRIVKPFANAERWLVSVGKNIIQGLISGMSSAIQNIGSWVKRNVVNPIINAIKGFFGIHSPSSVMMGLGGHIATGLIKGVLRVNPVKVISKIFGSMPAALGALISKGIVNVVNLPGKALRALGQLAGAVGGFLGGGPAGHTGNINLGQRMAAAYGWTGGQWQALFNLWQSESGWNERARNPSSGAYGIPQSLPASKMASAGADWLTNPATQIAWGLNYIRSVYGSPSTAWLMWQSRIPHWYDQGGWLMPGATLAVNKTGRPERVLGPRESYGATYNINIAVPPGANQHEIGRQVVETIKAYERGSGAAWRR